MTFPRRRRSIGRHDATATISLHRRHGGRACHRCSEAEPRCHEQNGGRTRLLPSSRSHRRSPFSCGRFGLKGPYPLRPPFPQVGKGILNNDRDKGSHQRAAVGCGTAEAGMALTPIRRAEYDNVLASSLGWATAHPRVRGLALVGSWARGEATMASDIDLVVLTDDVEPLSPPPIGSGRQPVSTDCSWNSVLLPRAGHRPIHSTREQHRLSQRASDPL
jgi:hypothetical protein